MKLIRTVALLLTSAIPFTAYAQESTGPSAKAQTLEGVVSGRSLDSKGKSILVESGGIRYWFSLGNLYFGRDIVGEDVTELGTRVRVLYRNLTRSGDGIYHGIALRVVSLTGQTVPPRGARTNGKRLIGLVDDSSFRYRDGCGCGLRPSLARPHNFYFLSEYVDALGKTAYMNIDGRTIPLSLFSTTRPARVRKGSRHTEVYKRYGATARITYIVTTPNRPGGEKTEYSATITVEKGGRSERVRGVGGCGC